MIARSPSRVREHHDSKSMLDKFRFPETFMIYLAGGSSHSAFYVDAHTSLSLDKYRNGGEKLWRSQFPEAIIV